jgi:hypothetical protein
MQPHKFIQSPKLPKWSMRPTWFMTPALASGVYTKCEKELDRLNKSKYIVEKRENFSNYLEKRNIIRYRFNNDKKRRDAELEKLYKKDIKGKTKLKLKIMKEKDHNDLLDCRLKRCYKESLNTLKWLIKDILTHADKKTGKYKLALKYKNRLEKNKLDGKKLTREDINAFDIEMVKIILKENIGKQYW